jgi:hypothetical protein
MQPSALVILTVVWDIVVALGPLLAAAAAAWAALSARRAAQQAAAKANLDLFLQFSEQYERLRVGLPPLKGLPAGKNAHNEMVMALTQPKYQVAFYNVFRLFEREHHLHKLGLVPPHIWRIWHADMAELAAPLPVREFLLKHRAEFRASFIKEVVEA